MRTSFLVLMMAFTLKGVTQGHSDCSSTIEICSTQTITLTASGYGGLIEEDIGPPCVLSSLTLTEIGSTWLSFSFNSSGVFYFTISTPGLLRDIDFVLFHAPNSNCEDYVPLRCMASGENNGPPIDSICLGPTGLSLNSTDYYEIGGCGSSHDNFLAPLNVTQGESYFLMVFDYAQTLDTFNYNIEFFSTAELSCTPVGVNENINSINKLYLFPNPALDQIELFLSQQSGKLLIQVIDLYGRKCLEQNFSIGDQKIINTVDLPMGFYVVRVFDEDVLIGTLPFVR